MCTIDLIQQGLFCGGFAFGFLAVILVSLLLHQKA